MAIDKSDYKRVFATVFTHAEELLLSAKQHPNALSQYLESWQEVAEKAAEVDNLALQDVILLFIDASNPAFKKNKDIASLSEAQWLLLKKWDNLFSSYINTPENQDAAFALIQCLNDPVLKMGLELEDQQMLLDSFQPVIKQLITPKKAEVIVEQTVAEKVDADEIDYQQPISVWKKLTVLFDETNLAFQELLARNLQSSNEAYAENVKYYLENWKVVAEFIETERHETVAKISDILSLWIEFNCQLFNQVGRLSNEQQDLLKQWHHLFAEYIKANGTQRFATALVRLLANPIWLEPISPTDEEMLLAEFKVLDVSTTPPATDNAATLQTTAVQKDRSLLSNSANSSVNSATFLPSDNLIDTQRLGLWKALEKYFIAAVLNLKAMIAEQKLQNKQGFAEHLQNYNKNWQHIIVAIKTEESQAGLLDVILLFMEITSSAFEQMALNNQHLLRLKKWHDLFAHYIKSRGNNEFVLPLIQCLSDSFWSAAIAVEDEQMLLAGFNLPSVAVTQEQSEVINTVEVVAETTSTTVNVSEESAKNRTIWQQLDLLLDETTVNLTAVAEIYRHQQQALKASLQNYLESWLNIAQQIEINGQLLGLQDVVLIFIEESRQTFSRLENFNQQHITLLHQWQTLFRLYLKEKGNQQFAASLIKCLRDPLWEGAIMAEDEEMLLEGFLSMPESQTGVIAESLVETESVVESKASDVIDVSVPSEQTEFVPDTEIQVKKDSSWQEIGQVFNQAAAILTAAVDSEMSNEVAACQRGLQEYIECWQIITDILATDENLSSLSDVVLLFTEISKQTFINLNSLNSKQLALLTHWQNLFKNFFTTPNKFQCASGLIKCLGDSSWSEPIQLEDELMLLEGFGADDSAQMTSEAEQPLELIDNIPAETEKNPLWQKITVFFDDTELQLPIMQELLAVNNHQTCHNYLQQYAERWLIIAEIIEEENNLQTFADVVFLFADNCMELVQQNVTLTALHLHILQAWHTAFATYLQTTNAKLSALIECLESSLWLHPLTEMDKEMLLATLADETQQQVMSADESENSEMLNNEVFAKELEEEPVSLVETEILVTEHASEFVDLLTEEATTENADEDFALFAEEQEKQPLSLIETQTSATEQESESVDLLTEDRIEEATNEDFSLFNNELKEEIGFATEQKDFVADVTDDTTPQENADSLSETLVKTTSVNPELIGMVRDEFALLVKEFNTEMNAALDAQAFKIVLKNHEFKFQNLAKACHTIGLLGLEQVFRQLSLNMRSRRGTDILSDTESELFKASLPLLQNYIAAITERDNAIVLVAHLSMQGWKQPLTEAEIEPLIQLLSGLVVSSHNQQLDNRKRVAELADVSLELPEDVNSELLDSLLNELPVLTSKFSAVIQKIISNDKAVPQLLEAQRIAHTLKGSGNIVGVSGIAVLTHHLEEILEYLTKHETFPTKALAGVLMESADCLEMMSDLMFNGETQPPDQALSVLQNVLNWANQIANDGLPTEDSVVETTTLPALPDTNITPVVKESKSLELVAMTRVPSETIDKLLRMTGEGSILSEQFKERIKGFSNELKLLNELTWQMSSLVSELDQSINIQSYSTKTSRAGANAEFDALEMEQYNELHTATSRIAEVATDIREINIQMDQQLIDLKYLMAEEDAIQKENQEMVQSIRMVPASTITSRCQRIVRQACRATNKEVDLEIKGAEILIDSEILNGIVEPLMHLLRNSIDHGIEPLHIREKYNKPRIGKITLEFSRKGNYAVISCKDDGAGLASGNILQTAIKKGLISAKQQLTEAEIHKLILIPGFSTRAVATQTSGRGIGMDAIQTKISAIQGQMSLFSARGEGLTIEITIPLTLSSMLSLLVKCGGQTMAISNRGLRKIHHSDECTVVQEAEQLYCDIDYQRYPAKYFSELVGIPMTYTEKQKLQALQIEDEIGRTHIVFVEELLGYKDLLVKNMGSYIPHIQGITGASILGNGDVAPVIDLVEMLHHAAKYDYLLADATNALADSINGLPVALVIDDSLSARRAVAMLLKDSGLEVETAIDGLDAIKQIDKLIPDIILVDLEMPRMNGIELTAHVRGREDMKDTPIIMITSRATEKHRKQAEAAGVTKFMTKPFTEDDLISNVKMLMK